MSYPFWMHARIVRLWHWDYDPFYWEYDGPFWHGGWHGWYDGWWPYWGLWSTRTREPLVPTKVPEAPPPPTQTALSEYRIELDVRGQSCLMAITQVYRNRSTSEALEVSFAMSLGKDMVVTSLEAVLDGKTVRGEIQRKADALAAYDDAISSGHTPALGSQNTAGLFEIALGNLAPGKEMAVTVHVLSLLVDSEDSNTGALFFGLPAQVLPAPHVLYDLSIRVRAPGFTGSCIVGSETVALGADGSFERKFPSGKPCTGIIAVEVERPVTATPQPVAPYLTVEQGPTFTAELSISPHWPEQDDAYQPVAEIFLVIDRSGSMVDHKRLASARQTALLFVSSIPMGCKFQVIGFGSRYTLLFNKGSQVLDATTLEAARKHCETFQADLGGTNLLDPLEYIVEERQSPEFPRFVFVVTDGDVTNRDEVLALVRRHSVSQRVFAIGLGATADRELVKGLARAGRGTFDMVSDDATGNAQLQPIIIRQLQQALAPTLRCPKIVWTGGRVDTQFPAVLPCVQQGERLTVHALDVKLDADYLEATLQGIGPDGMSVSFGPVRVDKQHFVSTGQVSKLAGWLATRAAAERLSTAEDVLAKARPKTKPHATATADVAAKRKELETLALRYGLATSVTSWIAVCENETFHQHTLVTETVPGAAPVQKSAEPPKPVDAVKQDAKPATVVVETSKVYHHHDHHKHQQPVPVYSPAPPPAAETRSYLSAPAAQEKASRRSEEGRSKEQADVSPRRAAPAAAAASASYSVHDDECEADSVSGRGGSSSKSKKAEVSFARRVRSSRDQSSAPASSHAPRSPAPDFRDTYNAAPSGYSSSYYSHTVTTYEAGVGNPEAVGQIAKLQAADGHFALADMEKLLSDLHDIAGKNPANAASYPTSPTLWATALAIAYCENRLPYDEVTWRLLVRKARAWLLKAKAAAGLQGVDFIASACSFVHRSK